MIFANKSQIDKDISRLVGSLRAFPGHIARKHLTAAAGRAIRPFRGIMVKATPPGGARKGRPGKNVPRKSTGNLRRSVAVIVAKSKKNRNGGFAVMGYRGGPESRKAIWLEYGTKKGIAPRNILRTVMAELGPKAKERLPQELAKSIEKAAAELAGGKNPGR